MTYNHLQLNKGISALIHCMQFPIMILTTNFIILEINEAALNLYHWQHKNALQKNIFGLCHEANIKAPASIEYFKIALSLSETNIQIEEKEAKGYHTTTKWNLFCSANILIDKKVFILSGKVLSCNLSNLLCINSYEDLITQSMASLIKLASIATGQGALQEQALSFKQLFFSKGGRLQEIIKLLPGEIYWEDRNLMYLGCNDYCAEIIGLVSPKDLIGQDDLFIKTVMNTNYPEQAYELWRHTAQSVMEKKIALINMKDLTYAHPDTGEVINSRTSKIPIIDNTGNAVGILGMSINRDNPEHIKQLIKANKLLQEITQSSFNSPALAPLSTKELICVESRAKGKTIKQIAIDVKLSPRTIETYLNRAKLKTGCINTNQLNQLYWEHTKEKINLSEIIQ